MKVTNNTTGTLYLKDLHLTRQSQTEGRRSEDSYLGPGVSRYLPDTSEVLRSVQKGDLYLFQKSGKVSLHETVTLAAYPGPGNSVTLTHNLSYPPTLVVLKKVVAGSVVTWVDAQGTVDVTHNASFTTVTIKNVVTESIEFLVRIG